MVEQEAQRLKMISIIQKRQQGLPVIAAEDEFALSIVRQHVPQLPSIPVPSPEEAARRGPVLGVRDPFFCL